MDTGLVQELYVPSEITMLAQTNVADFAFEKAAATPEHVSLRRRVDGSSWSDVTAAQFIAEVTAVAKGLIAAGIGVGDRVAVMSKTRYEWTVDRLRAVHRRARWSCRSTRRSSAEQVEWILSDSGAGRPSSRPPTTRQLVESVRSRHA